MSLNYKEVLEAFTLMYNVLPHSATGKSQSELLFGRNIRDRIPTAQALPDDETVDDHRFKKHKEK